MSHRLIPPLTQAKAQVLYLLLSHWVGQWIKPLHVSTAAPHSSSARLERNRAKRLHVKTLLTCWLGRLARLPAHVGARQISVYEFRVLCAHSLCSLALKWSPFYLSVRAGTARPQQRHGPLRFWIWVRRQEELPPHYRQGRGAAPVCICEWNRQKAAAGVQSEITNSPVCRRAQDESGTADSSGLDDSSQERFIGPLPRDGTVGCSGDYSSPSYSYSSILSKSETGELFCFFCCFFLIWFSCLNNSSMSQSQNLLLSQVTSAWSTKPWPATWTAFCRRCLWHQSSEMHFISEEEASWTSRPKFVHRISKSAQLTSLHFSAGSLRSPRKIQSPASPTSCRGCLCSCRRARNGPSRPRTWRAASAGTAARVSVGALETFFEIPTAVWHCVSRAQLGSSTTSRSCAGWCLMPWSRNGSRQCR